MTGRGYSGDLLCLSTKVAPVKFCKSWQTLAFGHYLKVNCFNSDCLGVFTDYWLNNMLGANSFGNILNKTKYSTEAIAAFWTILLKAYYSLVD